MDELTVRTLGGSTLHRGGVRLPPFPTRKSEILFGYLLIQRGRPIHRDVLCGVLWGDQPDTEARKALRTALWRVRSILESESSTRGTIVLVEGDQIGLSAAERVWVDAWELEDTFRRHCTRPLPLEEESARQLEDAVRLYRGDFMEAHDEEWCTLHRERLRVLFLSGIERLHEHCCAEKDWLSAITWAHQLLRHDPLREDIHRGTMKCHLAMGDRPSALRQYESCVRILRDELGIGPMDQTRLLHERILADEPVAPLPSDQRGSMADGSRKDPALLLEEVDSALRQIRALEARLERTRVALARSEVVDASLVSTPTAVR